ncbi:MAG: bifunctional 5,10-methylenetetrahydrofolate dehydrogenase/5,10-methenyltetrahydrofolate cyclohydrolase [Janthinobacterium lividum]
MSARVLDGLAIAARIKAEVKEQLGNMAADGLKPGLAVVLIGDDPASAIYVRNKVKTCEELGIRSVLLRPDPALTTADLLHIVQGLNERDDIDGILVQLPLPRQIDAKQVLEAIVPEKDVDGFHPMNVGRLYTGQDCLTPCTPTGVLEILRRSDIPTEGVEAVVVGRSDIVGKPTAGMLLRANATVTTCHIHTVNLAKHTREADILVVAVGRPGLITPDMVKPGAVLIDVGINRITTAEEVESFFPGDAERAATFAKRGSVVMGDIDPAAYAVAGAYTPVPGGVGALTIAMLMHNTAKAARLRRRLR